jgi:hypothetical protein
MKVLKAAFCQGPYKVQLFTKTEPYPCLHAILVVFFEET